MADENTQSTKLERLHKRQESKFNAIYKQANRWHERFGGSSGDPVAGMLGEFRDFLCNYWNFLRDTGDAAAPASSLEMVRDLSTALAIVNNQWTTVSRACEQRMDEDLRDVLTEIDEQAMEYYDRFTGYKRSRLPIMPIVYFDKVAAISRSDFISYPLLSIPFCDINVASSQNQQNSSSTVRWESSLAHELGHYIYWNSLKYLQVSVAHENLRRAVIHTFIARYAKTDNYEDIRKGISLLEIWSRWMEEVFADICGTLIEGPDYAESALDMTLEAPPELSAWDDGEHPLPYLRPLIAIEVLKWVLGQRAGGENQKARLTNRIAEIEQQWTDAWFKTSENAEELPNPREMEQGDRYVTGKDIEESVRLVVIAVLERKVDAGDDRRREKRDVTSNWYDGDKEANLGILINYRAWLSLLDRTESGNRSASRAKRGSQIAYKSGDLRQASVEGCEPSDRFESLKNELTKDIRDTSKGESLTEAEIQDRLRIALLSLGLEVRFGPTTPTGCARVRNVGWGHGNLVYT